MMARNRVLQRWIAALVLAALAFAHASVSVAACNMERGSMAAVIAVHSDPGCDCGEMSLSEYGPLYANRCVAHCTSDLQLAGLAVAIVRSPADAPVLMPRRELRATLATGLDGPPRGNLSRRILLHSFQI